MNYWDKVASRLSIPGLALVALGALLCYEAPKLCRLVFKERGDRAVTPMKVAGVVIALLGALVLLDFIPGL